MLELDHLAVSGETLEAAQHHVEAALGVPLQPGGQHAIFHTHNMLLGLEDGLYLEAIAINPDAPVPDRPRWFDLDRFAGAPRLTNWISRSSEISEIKEIEGLELGEPVALTRGDLRWRMAVPSDGRLPYQNCAPAVIEWQTKTHPASKLEQHGVRLRRLTVMHPDASALQHQLASHFSDDRVVYVTGDPGLHAEFDTPHGRRVLQ